MPHKEELRALLLKVFRLKEGEDLARTGRDKRIFSGAPNR